MQLRKSYTIDSKIKNISGRLEHIARENNTSRNYVDQRIKSQNLLWNLSLSISELLLKLQFTIRGKDEFNEIIKEYNVENATSLSLQTYDDLKWIRHIDGGVRLPSVIRHFLWKIGYDESEGKVAKIPVELEHETRCLQQFYKRYFESITLKIHRGDVEEIATKNPSPEVDVNFFVTSDILKQNEDDTLSWIGGDYVRHLNNEICATLWLKLTSAHTDDISFRKLFRIMSAAQVWPHRLTAFLDQGNINRLCDSIVLFLQDESDLVHSDDEIKKILLDGAEYNCYDVETIIPKYKFNYADTPSFIESVKYCQFYYTDAFDYQRLRSSYNLALGILLEGDGIFPNRYERVLKLFYDASRPYIVWQIYDEVTRRYPEIIPYLLMVNELSSLSFKIIDEVAIHPTFLPYSEHRDDAFQQSCKIKSELWLELFAIFIAQLPEYNVSSDDGVYLSSILLDIAEKVFLNTNNIYGNTQHLSYKARYDEVLKLLRLWRVSGNNSMTLTLQPRRIFSYIPQILNNLRDRFSQKRLPMNGYIHLQSGLFDLSIEMIRLSKMHRSDKEVPGIVHDQIMLTTEELLNELANQVIGFYSTTEVNILAYDMTTVQTQRVNRRVSDFGFEIIDWGYLFLHFQNNALGQKVYKALLDSVHFKTDGDQYDEQNKEELDKIQLYLLSILLAFLSLTKHKDAYEIEGLPVQDTIETLKKQIITLSTKFSVYDLKDGRVDAFDERIIFRESLYHERLTNLLFQCINFFDAETQEVFIEAFFHSSLDIGRMLEAVNTLESKKLQTIISKKISLISIEAFNSSRYLTSELKNALIDAANSEDHWALAKPLLARLKNHFEKVRIPQDNTADLLYEVDLLLAFKEKDIERLNNIAIPEKDRYYAKSNFKLQQLKDFFKALHLFHNEKNTKEAIELLKILHSNEPTSARFAFKLFEAETELALHTNDKMLLKQTNKDWEDFEASLQDDDARSIAGYREGIAANKLHYYAVTNNTEMFSHTINLLTSRYLYDEDLLPTIYKYYNLQGLHQLAHNFILKARDYYSRNGNEIPVSIQNLIDEAPNDYLLSQYKMGMNGIRSLPFDTIPKIIPEILNGKKKLDDFILTELICASRVMLDKIQGIKQITHENRYNDLLLACLRLRLPFYGWVIQDQNRKGSSVTEKDAGEADLVIEAAGQTIALIEALVLSSNETTKIQQHIKKCFGYASYLERYYIISYFKGKADQFDAIWESYKDSVLATELPSEAQMSKGEGFQDISVNFKETKSLHIGTTIHAGKTKMYHLMIKLS